MLMKPSVILAAALACSFALGTSAQTVATKPVGFNSTVVASGTVASLGVPFDRPEVFQGPVSSRTATTIVNASANGTYGPFASNPHAVLMLSGANVGKRYLIDSSDPGTGTLTITTGGDLTTQIANGDTFKVVPAHTLASLFGGTGTGLNVSGSAATADNVQLRSGGLWLTYFNNGTNWFRVGGGATNQNNVAVLPEQGFLLVRRPSSDYTFTGLGAVPTTNLRTDLPNNAVTHFANRFPTDTTLNNLGLQDGAGPWIETGSAATADNVLIRSGGLWLTYFHNGTNWFRVGGGATIQDNTPIPIGASVLVVRRPGTDKTLVQNIPYTL